MTDLTEASDLELGYAQGAETPEGTILHAVASIAHELAALRGVLTPAENVAEPVRGLPVTEEPDGFAPVVEAGSGLRPHSRARWVRAQGWWQCEDDARTTRWSSLVDPVLIREGLR